jgi:hypothetical protein
MTQYAVLPIPPHAPYPQTCATCGGRGVTGDRFEMPTTETTPTLLVDVICPDCLGCGNGDPDHAACPADAHAYPEEYAGPECECNGGPPCDCPDCDHLDCVYRDDEEAQSCPSCGSGRGWNAVHGVGTSEDGEPEGLAILRVPCGCSESRLVIGDDPAKLDSGPPATGF